MGKGHRRGWKKAQSEESPSAPLPKNSPQTEGKPPVPQHKSVSQRLWAFAENPLSLAALGVVVAVVVATTLGGILRAALVVAWLIFVAAVRRSELFGVYAGKHRVMREVFVAGCLGTILALVGYFMKPPVAITLDQISTVVTKAVRDALKSTHDSERGKAAGPNPKKPPTSVTSEPFAFTEGVPKTVTVLLDNGANVHVTVNLKTEDLQKQVFRGLLNLGGEQPLAIYIQDGIFYVDASVTDGSGREAIEIKKNRLEVKPPTWDRNLSPNAVEVVDGNQRPIFQMIRKRANLVQVAGLFVSRKGAILDARPARAIFKYPAWKYPGQYAEEDRRAHDSDGLAQLTPAALRSETHSLCAQIRMLGKQWDDGYASNGKKAIQAMRSARTDEERAGYERTRMDENERLYKSLEAQFNKEYRQHAQSLNAALLHKLNSPADLIALDQLRVPSLIESGAAVGPNPFNDACDYLANLAQRVR